MRGFMKRVDLFCYKHPRFGVNNLMLYIVFGTLAVWLLGAMDTTYTLVNALTFNAAAVLKGQVWRIITFVFIPQSSGLWLFLFLYFYYFVGSTLEREWGPGRFTIYYLTGMLMTIIYGFVTYFVTGRSYFMTSNYINLSMFFAFATLFPDNVVLLFFIIPVKVKWLAWIDAAFFAWSILSSLFHLNWVGVVLPVVAILNFLLFFSSDAARIFGRVRHRTSRQTINFKKATKEAKKDKGYLHKCAVCGITDADDPNMEFRYCSKCNGYYCYCMDHINNHVHIQ